MNITLYLTFLTEENKKISYSITDVKEDITTDEIYSIANKIINKSVFTTARGDLKELYSAKLKKQKRIK